MNKSCHIYNVNLNLTRLINWKRDTLLCIFFPKQTRPLGMCNDSFIHVPWLDYTWHDLRIYVTYSCVHHCANSSLCWFYVYTWHVIIHVWRMSIVLMMLICVTCHCAYTCICDIFLYMWHINMLTYVTYMSIMLTMLICMTCQCAYTCICDIFLYMWHIIMLIYVTYMSITYMSIMTCHCAYPCICDIFSYMWHIIMLIYVTYMSIMPMMLIYVTYLCVHH